MSKPSERLTAPEFPDQPTERQQFILDAAERDSDECLLWPWGKRSATSPYGRVKVNGEDFLTHRLVCLVAHGPAPSAEHQACHAPTCTSKLCVNANCLRWGTQKDNAGDEATLGTFKGEKNPRAQLTAEQVYEVREAPHHMSNKELATHYGVTHSMISTIRRRKSWRHLPERVPPAERPFIDYVDPDPLLTKKGNERRLRQKDLEPCEGAEPVETSTTPAPKPAVASIEPPQLTIEEPEPPAPAPVRQLPARYTIQDLENEYGMCRNTLYKEMREGRLQYDEIAGRRRFSLEQVEAWLAS